MRLSLDMTQRRLAVEAGVARASIANLEKGRQNVPLHQLIRIADALRIDYRRLMPEPARLERSAEERVTPESVQQKAPVTAALIERLQNEEKS
jgi:transcriptional regulator with XRE-family HTH domain